MAVMFCQRVITAKVDVFRGGCSSGGTITHVLLDYDLCDPLAVIMTIEGVRWTFARSLLSDVVEDGAFSGFGDVRCEHDDEDIILYLSSAQGQATITMPAYEVLGFIEDFRSIVPDGDETYDVDSWITQFGT